MGISGPDAECLKNPRAVRAPSASGDEVPKGLIQRGRHEAPNKGIRSFVYILWPHEVRV